MKVLIRAAFLLLVVLALPIGANPPPDRAFDEEALRAYQDDSDFQYGVSAQQGTTWLARGLYWLSEKFFEIFNTPGGSTFGRGLLYFILGIIVLGAVALIIQMRYGKVLVGSRDRSGTVPLQLEDEEDADYDQLLRDAQSSGELTLAARYLFLLTLQRMNRQGLIQWKKWKTSHDYAHEVEPAQRADYLALSRFFESSWFGGHEPTPEEIEDYQTMSKELTHA